MLARILRAFKNDVTLYSEIKGKPEIQSEALWVILGIAIVNGVISFFAGTPFPTTRDIPIVDALATLIITLVGYLALVVWVWFLGTVTRRGQGSFKDVRTALAYAYSAIFLFPAAPLFSAIVVYGMGFLGVNSIEWLAILSLIGPLLSLWILVTTFSAIRKTLEIGTLFTIIIVITSATLQLFVTFMLAGSLIPAIAAPFL